MATLLEAVVPKVLTNEEYSLISESVRDKLGKFIVELSEEASISTALLNSTRSNNDKKVAELETNLARIRDEHINDKDSLDAIRKEFDDLLSKEQDAQTQLTTLKQTVERLEAETSQYRQQRDKAVDERDSYLTMLERRNTEAERLKEDVSTLSNQLQAAITAKCVALAKVDEVQAQQYNLDFKEKRMDQERELLNNQIKSLTDDLNKHSTDILNLRRENTERQITLETQLTQKTTELKISLETNEQLTKSNELLNSKLETLTDKLLEQRDIEIKMRENYHQEIQAQKKLAELYKSMTDEASGKSTELETAVEELQKMMETAAQHYHDLEKRLEDTVAAHEAEIAGKNDCIRLLKVELEGANELVKMTQKKSLESTLENLSPAAAAASKLLKSGMTLTQIYSQYAAVTEELAMKTNEVERLQEVVKSILDELEEKTPLFAKERANHLQALETINQLTAQMDQFVEDSGVLRQQTKEAENRAEYLSRENKRFRTELADLARQVCHLLNEVQCAHTGAQRAATLHNLSAGGDTTASGTVISRNLVAFSDIEELQAKNQNLLAVVRELSKRQEEIEEANADMKPEEIRGKLQQYEAASAQMRVEQEQHVKMMQEVMRQRDVYQQLYEGARETREKEAGTPSPAKPSPVRSMPASREAERLVKELEAKLAEAVKTHQEAREEHASYRAERQTNELQLQEQIETMRDELRELRTSNGRLLAQAEYADVRFKTMEANAATLRTQITALEDRNKCYNDTIVKHELSISHLKDEALRAQKDAARAEVALQHLRQEHRMVKESEVRLTAEREAARRGNQSQALLMSNLDAIKNSLERVESEGQARLEARLDASVQECTALRRRLQEEEDRFRELRDGLERRMAAASASLQEERSLAARAAEELAGARVALTERDAKVEALDRRVKELLTVPVPSKETKTTAEVLERRTKDLEREVSEAQSKLRASQAQLTLAQQKTRQYCEISETAERQLAAITAEFAGHRTTAEGKAAEMQAACDELNKKLQLAQQAPAVVVTVEKPSETMSSLSAVRTELAAKTRELIQAEQDLSEARAGLLTAQAQQEVLAEQARVAEAKYSQEVVLHSADIQTLTTLKQQAAEVDTAVAAALAAKQRAEEALAAGQRKWEECERQAAEQVREGQQRVADLDAQNSLLHNQIQELSQQLATLRTGHDTSLNRSLNVSVSEDESRSSEELLQIIKYLRREKDIAVSQFDVLRLENARLGSELRAAETRLSEAQQALDAERAQDVAAAASTAKHAELMRKVDTLDAIMDSNRALRAERGVIVGKMEEAQRLGARLQAELGPLKDLTRELQAKVDALEAENAALRGEAARLRQRNNFLIERSNKASPEDWRKLQQERENLVRQLAAEKEAHQKAVEETRAARQEKARGDEAMTVAQRHHAEELQRSRDESAGVQQKLAQTQAELTDVKTQSNKKNEELAQVTEALGANEAQLNELRTKEFQVRKIAKKYKTQFEELNASLEEERKCAEQRLKEAVEAATAAPIAADRVEVIREEVRRELEDRIQEVNQRHGDVVKELNDQVSSSNEVSEGLRREIEALKESSSINILVAAKAKLQKTMTENGVLKQQVAELTSRCAAHEQTTEESTVRMNALKSQLEARIARAEKESAEKVAESQRQAEEIKKLSTRMQTLQRSLYTMQVKAHQGKPSTSSGGVEKPIVDPPTANIKPMAGPSSTAVKPAKQPQSSQQSGALAPWTGRGETPLASIRPMSMQSRTVAVLPTSVTAGHANTSNASAAALVAPQQQAVHTTAAISAALTAEALSSSSPTSSHTDYMPATSSASTCQAEPRQEAEAPVSAESTQDNEAQAPTCTTEDEDEEDVAQHTQQNVAQQAVALVQPRVEQTATSQPQQATTTQPQQATTSQPQQATTSQPQQATTTQPQQATTTQPQQATTSQPQQATTSQPPALQSPPQSHQMVDQSSNREVTSSAVKRMREMAGDSSTGRTEEEPLLSPQTKRVRLGMPQNAFATDSGVDVEYQVPTSSQRDQEDEIITVDSEEDEEEEEEDEDEEMPDDCLELEAEAEFEDDVEVYEVGDGYSQEEAQMVGYEGADIDETQRDGDNNEVEVLDDSGDEVPNQSESSSQTASTVASDPPQPTSSGSANQTDSSVVTSQHTPFSASFARGRVVPPLGRQQQNLLLTPQGYEDAGDDGIVPSTPTLFVPRHTDGFSEAVQMQRFTFSDSSGAGSARAALAHGAIEGVDDTRMDLTQLDDSTGRSVPTTPLLPQASVFPSDAGEGGSSEQLAVSCVPAITITEPPTDTMTVQEMPPPEQPGPAEQSTDNSASRDSVGQNMDSSDVFDEGTISDSSGSEKTQPVAEVDEGREAQATEQPPPRGRYTARRSVRPANRGPNGRGTARGNERGTGRPTPIVWSNEPRSSQQPPMPSPQQRMQRVSMMPIPMAQPLDQMPIDVVGPTYQQRGAVRGARRMRSGRPARGYPFGRQQY